MSGLPPGVVFDCDGTLADTEALSDKAWIGALGEHGYVPTDDDFREVVGYPFPENWAYFSARVDLGDQQAFRRDLRERFISLFDTELELHHDAVGTLETLVSQGVPVGVASSSTRSSVHRVLDRAGIRELVRIVVGVDDVDEHKPSPEPYLRAAAGLELDPRRCSAVEDTPVGVRSARAAGLFTVAVVRAHGDPGRLALAHRVVDEVTVEALLADPDHGQPSAVRHGDEAR